MLFIITTAIRIATTRIAAAEMVHAGVLIAALGVLVAIAAVVHRAIIDDAALGRQKCGDLCAIPS